MCSLQDIFCLSWVIVPLEFVSYLFIVKVRDQLHFFLNWAIQS